MERDILTHCKFFYEAFFIPIYIYKADALLGYFPEQQPAFYPPLKVMQDILSHPDTIGYISGSAFSNYGYLKVKVAPEYSIVIGPISGIPYEKAMLQALIDHYGIPEELQTAAGSFFRNIPVSALSAFLGKLVLMNHVINQEAISIDALFPLNILPSAESIQKEGTENVYSIREENQFNNSYEVEKLLLSFIADGNLEGFDTFLKTPMHVQTGAVATDNIRQLKNTFIVSIALFTRTAIQAGVETEIAFQLSDLYIKQAEQLTNPDHILSLQVEAIHTFTSKVSEHRFPFLGDSDIRQIVHYIQRHIDQPLNVDTLAEELRFNRSYLSHKFHKETGMKLHTFIQDCKIQEAKRLLSFTSKSISEISNYLCFSSQSHFQNVFKKVVGITPYQYRRKS